MKQMINLGAYGWRHKHWSNTFYPEDLPVEDGEDWRLAYYSNEFNAVLVPADYWQTEQIDDCEDWLDSVHPDFQFFVECHHGMFDTISLTDLTGALKKLTPRLSALVFLEENQQVSDAIKKQFIELVDSLEIDVYGSVLGSGKPAIWRPDRPPASPHENLQQSGFAFIEDELSDLRSARVYVEQFAAQINDTVVNAAEATLIVNHPQLQAGNLSKFRSVLEIMGY